MTVTQLGCEASVVCLTNDFAEEQERSVLCQKKFNFKIGSALADKRPARGRGGRGWSGRCHDLAVMPFRNEQTGSLACIFEGWLDTGMFFSVSTSGDNTGGTFLGFADQIF